MTRGQVSVMVGIGCMFWQGTIFGCTAPVSLACGVFTAAIWYLFPDAADE